MKLNYTTEFGDRYKNRKSRHVNRKSTGKGKGKIHPRTGHEVPGGSKGIDLLFL